MTFLIDFAKKREKEKQIKNETTSHYNFPKCSYCNRCFPRERLLRHIEFCCKINKRKREVFQSSKKRCVQTGDKCIKIKQSNNDELIPKNKKTNWRKMHQMFIMQMRQSKRASKILNKAMKWVPNSKNKIVEDRNDKCMHLEKSGNKGNYTISQSLQRTPLPPSRTMFTCMTGPNANKFRMKLKEERRKNFRVPLQDGNVRQLVQDIESSLEDKLKINTK
ncbi:hypothetical protein GJ496_006965 [Pomphorhynchus laevis]|nr:hypothetical protein GJ496_006965 [Pomphorhynchus laevis]